LPQDAKPQTYAAGFLVCAAISVVLLKTGFGGIFYLAPLGYALYKYGAKSGALAGLITFFVSLGMALGSAYVASKTTGASAAPVVLKDGLYTGITIVCFLLIDGLGGRYGGLKAFAPEHVVLRFTALAVISGLVYTPVLYIMQKDSAFNDFLTGMAASFSKSFGGDDASVTSAGLMSIMKAAVYRGLVVGWSLVLFGLNRMAALWAFDISARRRGIVNAYTDVKVPLAPGTFANFRIGRWVIWLFTTALFCVLASIYLDSDALGIPAWNILIITAFLFLVQGGGALVAIIKRGPPLAKLILPVMCIACIFAPVVILAAAAIFLVVGLIDNFVDFRR
jgi:hypothetical protein